MSFTQKHLLAGIVGFIGSIIGALLVLAVLNIWKLNVRISNIERFLNQAVQTQQQQIQKTTQNEK